MGQCFGKTNKQSVSPKISVEIRPLKKTKTILVKPRRRLKSNVLHHTIDIRI